MLRGLTLRNLLYALSCLPTEVNTKDTSNPSKTCKGSKILAVRPEDVSKSLEVLKATSPKPTTQCPTFP